MMYRLSHFQATNVRGFSTGLGQKTIDLDLSELCYKDIIVILGDNGYGKSTLMSLLHPTRMPTDKREKFIVPGKEGKILREYIGSDGTKIKTLAIYTPKKSGGEDDGHSAKMYFSITKPGKDEIEMNPSGNVTSYNELLYTYMGITKDYVNFASYNDLVRNIVDMTDTERKLNVSTLIPNTKRFETAYQIINEKYKKSKTILQNISQKISQLDSKDELQARLKRLINSLETSRKDRDKALTKKAKLEGRLKEISKGKSSDQLTRESREKYSKLLELYNSMNILISELKDIIKGLSDFESDNLTDLLSEGERLCERLPKQEAKYATAIAEREIRSMKVKEYRSQLSDLENEEEELNASLYSLDTQNIDDLKELIEELKRKISSMELYNPNDSFYNDLSFEVSTSLFNQTSIILNISQGLLDKYGDIYEDYYHGKTKIQTIINDYNNLGISIEELENQKDSLSDQIREREQYRKLQAILERRPKNCVDDTCPFIANALQWTRIQKEIESLMEQYKETVNKLNSAKTIKENYILAQSFINDHKRFESLIQSLSSQIDLYLHGVTTLYEVIVGLSSGNTKLFYDMQEEFKKSAAILSEKSMYDDITKNKLPQLEASMKLAENSKNNKELLEKRIKKLRDKIQTIRDNLDYYEGGVTVIDRVTSHTYDRLIKLRRLRDLIRDVDDAARKFNAENDSYENLKDSVEQINGIQVELEEYKEEIRIQDARIKEFSPAVDTTRYMLQQLALLKIDEAKEARSFLVTDIMRSIVQPGKGIWKEAIDIYMSEINTIANQVLRNTFDGKLILSPFKLTDKAFKMPYVYNGSEGDDISNASSSQRAIASTAISMAIISKMIDKYGTITLDEFDNTLSPTNKEIVAEVLVTSMRLLGIDIAYICTHNPENYEKSAVDIGYILFPGSKISNKNNKDFIEI